MHVKIQNNDISWYPASWTPDPGYISIYDQQTYIEIVITWYRCALLCKSISWPSLEFVPCELPPVAR